GCEPPRGPSRRACETHRLLGAWSRCSCYMCSGKTSGKVKEDKVRKLVALSSLAVTALVLVAVASAGIRAPGWTATLTPAQVAPKRAAKNPAASGSFSGTPKGYHLK